MQLLTPNIARVDLVPVLQRQSDLADLLVTQQKQASLPIRKIPVFRGDYFGIQAFRDTFYP